ncbi:MAG: indole-3-glycerol phosphate synthase TrpC [Planctomycetes bacterium]|nr:indole-3-glycerol phosphate synthase TrpC [Planctomycetota bacterium]
MAADALQKIMHRKRAEVAERMQHAPLELLRERVSGMPMPRNFFQAVVAQGTPVRTRVIAEVKRKSPSAGLIRADFDPVDIAARYHAAGASAISCLTDEPDFGGRVEFIQQIREHVPLPVLRKDFIVDAWQIWESRAAGADAILLIAECLTEAQIVDFQILAVELGLTTLLEVHDVESLYRVRPHVGFPHAGYALLGINNRDLRTMTTSLGHTFRMVDLIEDRSIVVSESGIRTPEDLRKLREHGVHIALVGEHLMKQPDPGDALHELLRPT